MNIPHFVHRWAIGLAMFSMFFGSGNLIFPLSIGQQTGDLFFYSTIGFLISGVLLPFAGIISMVSYQGDYTRFFSSFGKKPGFLLTFLLLIAWIPLGSAPRCIALSFANLSPFIPQLPYAAFSFIYCAFVFLLTVKKNRILDILGYILTPLLLLFLGYIVFQSLSLSQGPIAPNMNAPNALYHGLFEGYFTQDLIASFFFSSTIIKLLFAAGADGKPGHEKPLSLAARSSVLGVLLLGVVYIGLIAIAAFNSELLTNIPKQSLLSTLIIHSLGQKLAFAACIVVILACITTSLALTFVFTDFIHSKFLSNKFSYRSTLFFTTIGIFFISNLGFQGISAIISILMQALYPILIFLLLWNMVIEPILIKIKSIKSN